MKSNPKALALAVVAAVSAFTPLSAQQTLWEESFSGATLDPGWVAQEVADSTVAQNDGLELVPSTTNQFARGFLATKVMQGELANGAAATFNGNLAYDFFKHRLTLTYSGLSIPSDVTSGNLIFHSGVTSQSPFSSNGPRQNPGPVGAFLRMQQGSANGSLLLGMMESNGAGSRPFSSKALSGLPDEIKLTLDANGWQIQITGATFGDATTTHSGAWTILNETTFSTSSTLVVGTYNENFPVWTSGDPVILDGLKVVATDPFAEELWDEWFEGTSLDSGWVRQQVAGSAVVQNDGLEIYPSTSNQFARAFLATRVRQGELANGAPATFNGNLAYNFFKHTLTLTYTGLSIPSDITSGNLIFYSGITPQSPYASTGPRQDPGQAGAFLRMQRGTAAGSLVLGMMECNGTGTRPFVSRGLNGLPDQITLTLDADGWKIHITGATFADSTTTYSGTWTIVNETTFSTSSVMVVGTYSENLPAWTSGAPIILDGLRVVATAPPAGELRISAFANVGADIWEATLIGAPNTEYSFISAPDLDFSTGTLLTSLTQGDPGDPGTIGGTGNSIVTTDANGTATVRMTLIGPRNFIRAETAP